MICSTFKHKLISDSFFFINFVICFGSNKYSNLWDEKDMNLMLDLRSAENNFWELNFITFTFH